MATKILPDSLEGLSPDDPGSVERLRLLEEWFDELIAELLALRGTLESASPADGYEPLGTEEREEIRDRLEAHPDSELVGMLMTVHRLVELGSAGHTRSLAERETVMLSVVLGRFAPVAFCDALAVWSEHSDDEEADDA